jgi:hypothetical protein
MLLYKDENLRGRLIGKGQLQWQLFNQPESMEKLYNALVQVTRRQS